MPPCIVTMALLFQSTHSIRSATVALTTRVTALEFQSTHSIRSATSRKLVRWHSVCNFNPRTPYGVRLTANDTGLGYAKISIHALHTECDAQLPSSLESGNLFQSTHSIRSATGLALALTMIMGISIHALHTECDTNIPEKCLTYMIFQSTHSIRSATQRLRG
ncbi:hypothetical protein PAEAM_06090 [Paenibacillus sp. GM1FR]|nr:hypothetical protein PAEAM_06090 [Paenibacillus sp. GM1FR]